MKKLVAVVLVEHLGRVSLRLLELRILVVAWPSLPGLTAAMILLEPWWPELELEPRWKFDSSHSIRRFWFSRVVERSEEQLENLMVSRSAEVAAGLWVYWGEPGGERSGERAATGR